jgi:hypothetical protein
VLPPRPPLDEVVLLLAFVVVVVPLLALDVEPPEPDGVPFVSSPPQATPVKIAAPANQRAPSRRCFVVTI